MLTDQWINEGMHSSIINNTMYYSMWHHGCAMSWMDIFLRKCYYLLELNVHLSPNSFISVYAYFFFPSTSLVLLPASPVPPQPGLSQFGGNAVLLWGFPRCTYTHPVVASSCPAEEHLFCFLYLGSYSLGTTIRIRLSSKQMISFKNCAPDSPP